MKKAIVVWLLLVCMLAGCGKAEQSSNQQQEEMYSYAEPFYYADTVNCNAITADANGLLYTATYGDKTQEIKVYDLDGVCIEKAVLNASRGRRHGKCRYINIPDGQSTVRKFRRNLAIHF